MTPGQFTKGLKKNHSVPDEVEYVVEMLSKEIADDLEELRDIFAPDGRRIGEEKLSTEARLIQYKMELLDDPLGWAKWVWKVYDEMEAKLASIPYDVREMRRMGPEEVRSFALAFAIKYKSELDALLARTLATTEAEMPPVAGPVMEAGNYGVPA